MKINNRPTAVIAIMVMLVGAVFLANGPRNTASTLKPAAGSVKESPEYVELSKKCDELAGENAALKKKDHLFRVEIDKLKARARTKSAKKHVDIAALTGDDVDAWSEEK